MPSEAGYESRVAPIPTAALPTASPDSFGAGVGAGISQLGGALQRKEMSDHQIERKLKADQELSAKTAQFAQFRAAAEQQVIDLRTNAGPGGAGHTAAVAQIFSPAAKDALLAGVTENDTRNQLSRQFDEQAASTGTREYQWQAGTAAAKTGTDAGIAKDTMQNNVRHSADPQTLAEESGHWETYVQGLHNISDADRSKLSREGHEDLFVGSWQGQVDRGNAAAVIQQIDSGAFDSMVSPEKLAHMRNEAETESRRQIAMANAKIAAQKAETRESLATLNARLEAGEDVPDTDLVAGAAAATKIGDESGSYKLNVARVKQSINRETQPWLASDYETAINDLSAKGEKRTPAEDIRLKQLQTIAPSRITEFNNNPGGFMARIGKPAPALNLADPASIDARSAWARSASATTGRAVPLLTTQEAAQFTARAQESDAGRVEVANQLAAFGGANARAAARQVAPSDPMLERIVLLPPGNRAATLVGGEVRKGNRALIDGPAGTEAQAEFQRRLGPAAMLMSQGQVNAAFEVSRNLYAANAKRGGPQEFEANQYAGSIHAAFAGTKRPQTGEWQGGIGDYNGTPVLLPGNQTQQEFTTKIARLQWGKGPDTPVWHDGHPMTPGELKNYLPIQRADGWYEFHGTGGTVATTKSGSYFVYDPAQNRIESRAP